MGANAVPFSPPNIQSVMLIMSIDIIDRIDIIGIVTHTPAHLSRLVEGYSMGKG